MKSGLPLAFAAFALVALSPAAHAQSRPPDWRKLRHALNLSAAQEPAWKAFQTASAPDPQEQARDRTAAQMMPALDAPRRVDLSIAALKADLKSMEQRGAALKTFYATLSPAQQKVFDRVTAPRPE